MLLYAQERACYFVELSAVVSNDVKALATDWPVDLRYELHWLNGAVIEADTATVVALRRHVGVDSVYWIGSTNAAPPLHLPHRSWDTAETPLPGRTEAGALARTHERLGLPATTVPKSVPVRIAVLDGGFYGLNRHPYLAGLRSHLKGTFDFVDGDTVVTELSAHGTQVVALLAADAERVYKGGAPTMEYLLVRTEDVYREEPIELYNMMAGLEYAYAHGARIVHASLGYRLDSGGDGAYHTQQLHRALDRASELGLFVITSGGNQAGHSVSAPADHPAVLAVGALDARNRAAIFSSADDRKPELGAPGVRLPVLSVYGDQLHAASGTSYSAPLVTAMAARLWSDYPECTAAELRQALLNSADYTEPDRFGLPNYLRAEVLLRQRLGKSR